MGDKFLTPKQKQVLDFITNYIRQNDYSPSQQEIAKNFGFRSLGTVQHYLTQLSEQGYLEKSWNARRGVKPQEAENRIALVGKVAAGAPIEAMIDNESVEVPRSMVSKGGNYFSLIVEGDSMVEDGILDGDFVIVRKQETAHNGQTVVALLDNEATIKRYYRKKGKVELHPANPSYKPIPVKNKQSFRIEGVLIGVIRNVL